jgi:outer membrane lipoprotein LolB
MKRRTLLPLLLAATLAAGGCATPRKPVPPDGNYWHGRLALKVESDPPESMSASFELSGTAEAGELILSTPIGTTVAVLNWKPGEVLLQANGRERHFETLDELAREATGTAFPVAQLFAWLKHGKVQATSTLSAGGGWLADLSELEQGKLSARRISGGPPADLRLVLEK